MENNIKLLIEKCSELDFMNFIIDNIIPNGKCLIYTRDTFILDELLKIVKKKNEIKNISIVFKEYSRFIKNEEKKNIKKLFINGGIQFLICDEITKLDHELKEVNNIIYCEIPLDISVFCKQIKNFNNLKLCYIYLSELQMEKIKRKNINNIFLNQNKCYWKEILLHLGKNADFNKCNNCSNCIGF